MSTKTILMVAAENDDLPGAKVGGVGDVLRDLPKALIKQGCQVQSVIPSYGFLARLPKLENVGQMEVEFSGGLHPVTVFKRQGKDQHADIFILHSDLFTPQGESVYCHDGNDRPFATDATKFAFFSAAVAKALTVELIPRPDILHCHDWHSAFLIVLLRYVAEYSVLKSIKTIYSIHNLAMQGVRPFRGDDSAFETWFPNIIIDPRDIADIRVPHCINPMRAGILIADKVHTVSPTYAEEILQPSDVVAGIYGGEGLEQDLQKRASSGDLVGILNGCEYPRAPKKAKALPSKASLIKMFEQDVLNWGASQRALLSAHWLAEKRLKQWGAKKKPGMLITSVGRVTDQKTRLLTTEVKPGVTALSALLSELGTQGTFVMVGSGDKALEQALVKESAKHANFVFLNGFSPKAANALYECGDLFLMPSSFEPCGISQLLSMRAGQPCLVNRVGGLKDTIEPNKTGFAFEGHDAVSQAQAMVTAFKEAVRVFTTSEDIWSAICQSAKKQRFTWQAASEQYLDQLY